MTSNTKGYIPETKEILNYLFTCQNYEIYTDKNNFSYPLYCSYVRVGIICIWHSANT